MCVCEGGGGLENTKKRKEKWVDGGVGGGWKEQLICCWCLLDVGCKRSHLTRNRTVLLLVLSLLGFFFFFVFFFLFYRFISGCLSRPLSAPSRRSSPSPALSSLGTSMRNSVKPGNFLFHPTPPSGLSCSASSCRSVIGSLWPLGGSYRSSISLRFSEFWGFRSSET